MSGDRGTVLVVEYPSEARERIGRWLEDAGFNVLQCPGPTGPDYTCMAGRGVACPLASAADVVVLDLWLASDAALDGTPSSELLAYYRSLGAPVLVVAYHGVAPTSDLEDSVGTVEWPLERQEVVETVRVLLRDRARAPKGA